jgi:hypothetical protein
MDFQNYITVASYSWILAVSMMLTANTLRVFGTKSLFYLQHISLLLWYVWNENPGVEEVK